jgi:hypothetical protein
MLSTMRTPKAKRACTDCHRRKRRCTHVVSETEEEKPEQLNHLANQLEDLTTDEDNTTAMDREYDYDYNMNKSSATKRVRKGAQSQEPLPSAAGPSSAAPSSSSISKGPQGQQPFTFAAGPSSAGPSSSSISKGPQGQQPFTFTAGPSSAALPSSSVRKGAQSQEPLPSVAGPSSSSIHQGAQSQEPRPSVAGPSSSIPKAAPVDAVFAGIPTTVPSPEDPVNMYDVEEFLSNLEVMVRALPSPLPLFTTDRANNSATEGHCQDSR